MNGFLQDLRLGFRNLVRRPGFAAIAAGTLGLGIGAATSVFSLVSAVLLTPLPYPDSDRLHLVQGVQPGFPGNANPMSWPNFDDLRRSAGQRFTSLAATRGIFLNLTEGEGAERLRAARVTANLLPTLGVAPSLGRNFTRQEEEPGGPDVAMLAYSFWKSRFSGDRGLVGRTVRLEGKSYVVIGILPPPVAFPDAMTQVWIPFQAGPTDNVRGANSLKVLARLSSGISIAAADAELDAIAGRLARQYSLTNTGLTFRAEPLREDVAGKTRRPLWILLAAAALLLVVACVNVANLLLVRAAARRSEIAVRSALGGNRRRLVRQFVTESLSLGALAGGIGIVLAAGAIEFLRRLPPEMLPRAPEIGLDARVLGFSAFLAAATALVFGLVPALRLGTRDVADDLRGGRRGVTKGGRERRLLSALVVSEVGLALLLTLASGLLLDSFLRIRRVHPGFEPRGLWTATVGLSTARYPNPPSHWKYYDETLAKLSSAPGVESAAVMGRLPMSGFVPSTSFQAEDHRRPDGQEPTADYVAVSAGFFETMKIPILSGRGILDRDRPESPRVVVVNRALARREWPGRDPIGRRVEVYTDDGRMREVVGVVEDVNLKGLDEPPQPTIYVPLGQNAFAPHLRSGSFVARFRAGAGAAAAREVLSRYDPEQAVTPFRPMDDVVADSLASRRLNLTLTVVFGTLAVALAAVGISAVMANSVGQRRQEIGVRVAFGATARGIVRMLVADGARLAGAGIALGLLAAVPFTRVLSSLLYGVGPRDPGVFSGVSALVLAVALLAVWIPARRAAALDPVAALRDRA